MTLKVWGRTDALGRQSKRERGGELFFLQDGFILSEELFFKLKLLCQVACTRHETAIFMLSNTNSPTVQTIKNADQTPRDGPGQCLESNSHIQLFLNRRIIRRSGTIFGLNRSSFHFLKWVFKHWVHSDRVLSVILFIYSEHHTPQCHLSAFWPRRRCSKEFKFHRGEFY